MDTKREEKHPLSGLPGFTLRCAANAMMTDLAGRLSAFELNLSEASVLLLTESRQDLTLTEISRLLRIKKANMVPLLNKLEVGRLIWRKPIDRKSFAINLTKRGRDRAVDVLVLIQKFEDDLIGRIPEGQRAHFLSGLEALLH